MKHLQSFNQFINESYAFKKITFNHHTEHNPQCDILEGHIDNNSFITYGIYVKGDNVGEEFMEYYSGPNYVPSASGRSHSKMYKPDSIPSKYKAMWDDLKTLYLTKYKK